MTWTVYAVKTLPDEIVRYIGLTTDLEARAANHRNARAGQEIAVVRLEEHPTKEAGTFAEARQIAAHSGPHLENLKGQVAPEHLRADLGRLVASVGDAEAARRVGISRNTLARVLGALPIANGTISTIEKGLRP